MISNQMKKIDAAASYKTALLHSSAAAATVIYALFSVSLRQLVQSVLKRDHCNKEPK